MRVVWRYPAPGLPRDPLRFYFPDDAFFTGHGTAIISNQEQNETIIKLAYPSGKIIWSFGHPAHSGTAPGYLNEPDDAYLLKDGQVTVADAQNCRVLVINANRTVAHHIGTDGVCVHHPPASMGSPNGDTPLADGNLLVSEINGSWVSEYTPAGKLVWTVHLPISYPSDPQQLGPDRYLIADYASPGQILEFNREGTILSRYRAASGPGMLNHPRWPNCCRAACSWPTTTTTTAWSRSTRPPARWYGSTASPASRVRRRGNSTPRMALTCCCRTARHRRTR